MPGRDVKVPFARTPATCRVHLNVLSHPGVRAGALVGSEMLPTPCRVYTCTYASTSGLLATSLQPQRAPEMISFQFYESKHDEWLQKIRKGSAALRGCQPWPQGLTLLCPKKSPAWSLAINSRLSLHEHQHV